MAGFSYLKTIAKQTEIRATNDSRIRIRIRVRIQSFSTLMRTSLQSIVSHQRNSLA